MNQRPQKNTVETDDSENVSNGSAVVVRKEDQRAMDTAPGIEQIGLEKLNLYSCETNPQ